MKVDDEAVYLTNKSNEALGWEPLWPKLLQAAKSANQIQFVSGYTKHETVIALMSAVSRQKQASCKVRILLCPDGQNSFSEVSETKTKILVWVEKSKFNAKNVQVSIADPSKRHIHVKLYMFLNRTHRTWFIGSANLTNAMHGNREELMLRLTGSHQPMQRYVDDLFDNASVGGSKTAPKGRYKSLEDAIQDGRMIVKFERQIQVAFDGIENSQQIAKAVLDKVALTYASEGSGLTFNVAKALGFNILRGRAQKLEIAANAIETNYGLWCPAGLYEAIEKRLEKQFLERTEDLKRLQRMMSEEDPEEIWRKHKDHAEEIQDKIGVEVKLKRNAKESFISFYRKLESRLNNPDYLSRYASKYRMVEVPPVFNFSSVSNQFLNSWADEIIYFGEDNQSANRRKLHRCFFEMAQSNCKNTKADLDPDKIVFGLRKAIENLEWTETLFVGWKD
jgi:HKD family nuclease